MLPISTCSMADPDWWRMSRLTGASLSPMVTVSALVTPEVFASSFLPRVTAMATITATAAMMAINAISHFFGPCDFAPFDDFARAFNVASVLAVDCGCCSFSCLVASASPCAPVGDDMGFLLFVFSIMCCDCG